MTLTNAERQARHRAKAKAAIQAVAKTPTIYDAMTGDFRQITPDDVEHLVCIAAERAELRQELAFLVYRALKIKALDPIALDS